MNTLSHDDTAKKSECGANWTDDIVSNVGGSRSIWFDILINKSLNKSLKGDYKPTSNIR